jgi:hypothetical protein
MSTDDLLYELNGSDLVNALGQQGSTQLQAAGIPGLRYLDAGSRNAGAGTSNFVIWDQALLDEMARRMQ